MAEEDESLIPPPGPTGTPTFTASVHIPAGVPVTATSGGMISRYPASGGYSPPTGGGKPLKAELVPLPGGIPRKVLVAFFYDEDGAAPEWAAYLLPMGINVDMNPAHPEDARMALDLSLLKHFEQ